MHQILFSRGYYMSKAKLIAKLNENIDIDDLIDIDLEIELMERMK